MEDQTIYELYVNASIGEHVYTGIFPLRAPGVGFSFPITATAERFRACMGQYQCKMGGEYNVVQVTGASLNPLDTRCDQDARYAHPVATHVAKILAAVLSGDLHERNIAWAIDDPAMQLADFIEHGDAAFNNGDNAKTALDVLNALGLAAINKSDGYRVYFPAPPHFQHWTIQ